MTTSRPRSTRSTYFRVVDPVKSVVEVERHRAATSQIAQTTLRSVLGKADLDHLLGERERLNEHLQQIIDEQTDPWGIKVTTVEIKDVGIPSGMQRAMARQAEAERERRAKIINAEGEFQASERLFDAAEIISGNPAALQLRYLQTLLEVSNNQASTIVLPSPHRPAAAADASTTAGRASGVSPRAGPSVPRRRASTRPRRPACRPPTRPSVSPPSRRARTSSRRARGPPGLRRFGRGHLLPARKSLKGRAPPWPRAVHAPGRSRARAPSPSPTAPARSRARARRARAVQRLRARLERERKPKTSSRSGSSRSSDGRGNVGAVKDTLSGGVNSAGGALSSAGSALGGAAKKAKTPAIAGGAALAGLAGGIALAARDTGPKRVLGVPVPGTRKPLVTLKVKSPRGSKAKSASKDILKAAEEVGSAGRQVSNLLGEVDRVRAAIDRPKSRSPVEVLLEGLTSRRGGPNGRAD